MRFESVGKQVARLLDRLMADGFDLIEWKGKTRCWRLKPEVRQALDADTVAAGRVGGRLLPFGSRPLSGIFSMSAFAHVTLDMSGW
ncbi:MAG: hypothetical protein SNJ79_06300 [Sphingomonadaceae bacterium]